MASLLKLRKVIPSFKLGHTAALHRTTLRHSSTSGSGSDASTPLVDHKAQLHTKLATTPFDDYQLPEIATISLRRPVPGLPEPVYQTPSTSDTLTRVTTLDNGIRVASVPKFGSFCTVGVVLDSGSRYEVAYPSGISHFLGKLAFGETLNMTSERLNKVFEKHGGIKDCQSTRDAVIYASSIERGGLEQAVEAFSEAVWRPKITPEEFQDAQMSVSFDLENLEMSPEKEMLLLDMIHRAAYRDNTVGLPSLCPMENIAAITREHLISYMADHHGPERLVVAGVGVDHDRLVAAVERSFATGSAIWETEGRKKLVSGRDVGRAQYTGGECLEEADLSNVSIGPTPFPELCHVALGLSSVHHQHEDFVPFCVLNILMGGGGSFSAGGPGKGMYSRMYTKVLNRHHWIHSAAAINHAYADAGLFAVLASCPPAYVYDLVQVLTRELHAVTHAISDEELARARCQLQSMVLMNLETKPVLFEDLARQVLAVGERKDPSYFAQLIEKVTLDDLHRIASQMLTTKLSLAAYGSLAALPKRGAIESALQERNGALASKPRNMFFR